MSKWMQRCRWNPYMHANTCCSNTFIRAATDHWTLPKSKVWEPIIGFIPVRKVRYKDECLHRSMYTSIHGHASDYHRIFALYMVVQPDWVSTLYLQGAVKAALECLALAQLNKALTPIGHPGGNLDALWTIYWPSSFLKPPAHAKIVSSPCKSLPKHST